MASPKQLPLERRYFVYLFLLAAAVFTYTAALAALYNPQDQKDFWKFAGLFLGPTLVAVGWVVTNEVNTRNSRKQHTLTLLMQYFTNTQRISDKEKINKDLPYPMKLSTAKVNFDSRGEPLIEAIVRELNYLDFLASAVLHREIDERLFRRVFVTILPHYAEQLGDYIDYWRGQNPVFWEDFIALRDRWAAADNGKRTPGSLPAQGPGA